MRRRLIRRLALLTLVLLLVLASAGFVLYWWLIRDTGPPWLNPQPPDFGWTAVVSSIAGDGAPGMRDGPADSARFDDPFGIAIAPDGAIYIADAGDTNRIRRLGTDGWLSTFAGGAYEGLRDARGTEAAFHSPSGLAIAPDGTLYVADTGNHAIRRVSPTGTVTTFAGAAGRGFLDGPADMARFDGPIGLAFTRAGDLVVADTYNDAIRVIAPDGEVRTLAGGGESTHVDGPRQDARFDTPSGVAVASDNAIWIADTGNHALRRIHPDGDVATVGPVGMSRPLAVTAGADGSVYVSDQRGRLWQVSAEGEASLLAGSAPGFADGQGAVARFGLPSGLAVNEAGAVIVADASNRVIRHVAPATGIERPPRYRPVLPRLDEKTVSPGLLAWPLAPRDAWHEVTGTPGEPRGDAIDGRRRLHAGLDILGPPGTRVVAVRDEKVVHPLPVLAAGTVNESLSVGLFTYVHIRVGRDARNRPFGAEHFDFTFDERGRFARVRVRRGARFAGGAVIGTTNAASHVHLEMGPRGGEIDPLTFNIGGFSDMDAPIIERGGVRLFSEDGLPFETRESGRLVVRGRVRVEVEAYDQVDDNLARRRLGLHRLGYQVLLANGRAAPGWAQPRITIDLRRLPSSPSAARVLYAEGSGIAGGGRRRTRFIYTVTNVVHGHTAYEDFWDTGALPTGDYILRIIAEDRDGNRAVSNRDVLVRVVRAGAGAETLTH
jgi:DNA-binding beta-propeller fold protein YncE